MSSDLDRIWVLGCWLGLVTGLGWVAGFGSGFRLQVRSDSTKLARKHHGVGLAPFHNYHQHAIYVFEAMEERNRIIPLIGRAVAGKWVKNACKSCRFFAKIWGEVPELVSC